MALALPQDPSTLRTINACIMPLCLVDGAHIITVEGIGSATDPHVIQERLSSMHGSQCGFCTPGVVTSIYATLENGKTTEQELERSIEGNLCRCELELSLPSSLPSPPLPLGCRCSCCGRSLITAFVSTACSLLPAHCLLLLLLDARVTVRSWIPRRPFQPRLNAAATRYRRPAVSEHSWTSRDLWMRQRGHRNRKHSWSAGGTIT